MNVRCVMYTVAYIERNKRIWKLVSWINGPARAQTANAIRLRDTWSFEPYMNNACPKKRRTRSGHRRWQKTSLRTSRTIALTQLMLTLLEKIETIGWLDEQILEGWGVVRGERWNLWWYRNHRSQLLAHPTALFPWSEEQVGSGVKTDSSAREIAKARSKKIYRKDPRMDRVLGFLQQRNPRKWVSVEGG